MRKMLGWIAILLVATNLSAQNQYYVSPTGNDSNPGTQASPWRTFTHANNALVIGSPGSACGVSGIGACVHAAQGQYNECVVTNKTAPSTARIRYISDTWLGAKIVCDGSINPGGQPSVWGNGTGSNTRVGDNIDIVGFEMTPLTPTNRCSIIANYGARVLVQYNYLHDAKGLAQAGSGICGAGGAGIAFLNNGNPPTVQNHSIADGNIIDNIGTGPSGDGTRCANLHGIYLASPQHTVTNNIITRSCGWAVHAFHDTYQDVVTNNVFVNNYNGGILISASDGFTNDGSFVANNVVANNGPEGGIEEKYGSTGPNNVYHNNALWGNAGPAYNLTLGSRTVTGTVSSGSNSNFFNGYSSQAKLGDWTLKTGSPGIAAGYLGSCATGGLPTCIPSTDQVGNAENNPIDIGARAFGGTPPPPPPPTGLLTPTGITFPDTNSGDTSAFKPIAVHNTSAVAVHFTSITASTNFSLVTSASPCPIGGGGLAAGATCEVDPVFSPPSGGTFNGTVTFVDDFVGTPSSPQTVTLTGTGLTPTAPNPPTGLTVEVR